MERICDNSTPCVPCSPTDLCQQDCGNPLTNYSSEAADGIDFIGVSWQIDCANHTLVFQRGDSQAEANDNAQALAYGNMFINTCPGAGIIPGGGVPLADSGGGDPNLDPNDPTSPAFDTVGLSSCDPPGGCDGDASVRHRGRRPSPRRHVFYNAPQTCTICCANGDCQGFTTFGGKFPGLSQLAADRAAHSYACRQARLSLVCFGTPRPTFPRQNNSFIRIIGNNFKCCSGSSPSFTIPAVGKGPFGWSIISGSIPDGMTALVSSDSRGLAISGSPTSSGDSIFTVRIQNTLGAFAQQTFVISAIGITTDTLPNVQTGQPYNQSLTAVGGVDPHTFTLVSGDLPPGLTLADDGTISGTPICSGSESFTFTVSVTDANGPGCNKTLSISCSGCDWLDGNNPPANPNSWDTMNFQFVSSGGVGPYTFVKIAGTFPDGISLSLGGLLSGVPSIDQDTTYNYSVEVTDSNGDTCTKNFIMNLKGFCNPAVTKRPRIKNYVDNLIGPCLTCSGPIGPDTMWNGTFPFRDTDFCPTDFFTQSCRFNTQFRVTMDNGTGGGFGMFAFCNLGYNPAAVAGACTDWYLTIKCDDGSDFSVFWKGKLTLDPLGNPISNTRTKNPSGTYTRVEGCDLTASVQVELY